ncbi:MAG TPA: DNA-3-methyladenine glycosylase [Coriobacteriia bacterium]|nr:DNA-3-methyladenine glycosylase [Coriobacteriia bacterium]
MRAFDDIRLRPFGTALEPSFFTNDAPQVARDLLGCVLASVADGALVAGRIVETEAYLGSDDPGSHAATKGMTRRNAVMYGPAGQAYVYFTYGNHHMLNVVADSEGRAAAVLIRAVEPLLGVDVMTNRRKGRPLHELCNGPGKLAQAFGIDLRDNATVLGDGRLAVFAGEGVAAESVRSTGRIGLSAGHELPLRFLIADSPFVSRGRIGPRVPARRR